MIYTIGHSTRTKDEFIELLKQHNVEALVDIRTIPRSRHNPQFNSDKIAITLSQSGIQYFPLPGLGGLRRPLAGSINTGWRNQGFRGFADYMLSRDFEDALEEILKLEKEIIMALMCAEALYWRCHRSLVSDALTVRGVTVKHILSHTKTEEHRLTSFASVDGFRITYPAAEPNQTNLDFGD